MPYIDQAYENPAALLDREAALAIARAPLRGVFACTRAADALRIGGKSPHILPPDRGISPPIAL